VNTYHYRDRDGAFAPKFALQAQGPWIEVVVTHPKPVVEAIQETGATVSTERAIALIDTGASMSVVSDALALKLGLLSTDNTVRIQSVQDQQERPEYFAAIRLPWGATENVVVAACLLEIEGIDCLIGRDIMMNWIMTYNGREGSITISDE